MSTTPEPTDHDLRKLERARDLISLWTGLFKSLHLYDWEHDAVQSFAERVLDKICDVRDGEGELDLTVRSDSIFIDGVRIRESTSTGSSYHQLATLLQRAQVASFRVHPEADPQEIQLFAHLLCTLSEGLLDREELVREMKTRGATHVELSFCDGEEDLPHEGDQDRLQQRIYLRSVGVLKGVFHEAHTSDRINSRRVKRVVQEMIDTLEHKSSRMLGLTAIKNYDEYTFNHSVNVAVVAMALARSVGLSRQQLYIVGQAGLLHDLGKLCVPREILNKPGRLTPEERAQIRVHPVEGFFSIATRQGVSSDTISIALGAYEHHLNLDGTGYPETAQRRPIGLLSRILAIVDRYDAMTSARVYRSAPISPSKALSILFHSHHARLDQVVLRYFMNLMGYYPLGAVVRLSDDSVAIIIGGAPDETLRRLPTVKLVLDGDGRPGSGETIDLAAEAKGDDPLQVVETLNAADYGIEPMDYIV
jgi:HD-GYP domain-containing protein (c-di-GMP phosphodiesterase class II)